MQTNATPEASPQVEAAIARLGIDTEFSVLAQSLAEVLRTPPEDEDAFEAYHGFLQREPGFAARVLSLANTPALGARTPIGDLEAALVWLGTTGVRGAILSVAVMDSMKGNTRLLLQAAGCAAFSARVGRLLGDREPNEYFVAGLLHNIGKLLVLTANQPPPVAICDRLVEGMLSIEEEREALGCTHGEIGAWFAHRWRLPPVLVEAIRDNQEPPADASSITHVVARGREWVRNFALDHLHTAPDTERVLGYFEARHGIQRDALLAALEGLADDVGKLTTHLHEEAPSLTQTVRLLQEANLALGAMNAQAEALRRRAEEQMRHLRILQELATSSGNQPSIEAMCQNAVTLISKRLGLGVVSIMKLNADGELVVAAGVGIPRGIVGNPEAVRDGRIARQVMNDAAPVLVTNLGRETTFRPSNHADRYTTASALSVPLLHAGTVLAVLNLNNKRDGTPFTERDRQLFETIGHHLGSILNAEEQRARHEKSEGRFQALAAATPAALVGFDQAGTVWLWSQGAARLTGIPGTEALGKPIPSMLHPVDKPGAVEDWLGCLRRNEPLEDTQYVVSTRKGKPVAVLSTVVPLEGGRVGVWMGVNISGEKDAQRDAQKRAMEIAAINRVMTRILSELDRERMLAIFIDEALRAASVEMGALIALRDGRPNAVLVMHGFATNPAPGDLLEFAAGAMPEATTRYDKTPPASTPAASAFLEREGIRDTVIVRLPVPATRGYILMGCNTADPAVAENSVRVLEDMATVAAIGLRVANDLAGRVRYERLRVAASMAVTYNHEVNNALQVIQAAVDFANRAGSGIEGDDLKAVEQAIDVIQDLNEALGSKFVPAFTRYADGSDMIDMRAGAASPASGEGSA